MSRIALGSIVVVAVAAALSPTATAEPHDGLSVLANEIERSHALAALADYPDPGPDHVRVLVVYDRSDERTGLVVDSSGALHFFDRPRMWRAREADLDAPTFSHAEIRELVVAMKRRPIALKLPKSWLPR
jgi:hypothetical protein